MSDITFNTFAKKVIYALKELEYDLSLTKMDLDAWFNFLEDELDITEEDQPYFTYEEFIDEFIGQSEIEDRTRDMADNDKIWEN